MAWTPYDWLNELYSFYMVALVSIIISYGLSIDLYCKNQASNGKLALYEPWIHFNCCLKQLYINNKMEEHYSVIKMGVVCNWIIYTCIEPL